MNKVTSITLSGKQLLDALSLIVGSISPSLLATNDELETEINITSMEKWRDNEGGENPPGLYASLEEYPEEGLYGPLGETHEVRKIAARAVDEDRSAALQSPAAASAHRLAERIWEAAFDAYCKGNGDKTAHDRAEAAVVVYLASIMNERTLLLKEIQAQREQVSAAVKPYLQEIANNATLQRELAQLRAELIEMKAAHETTMRHHKVVTKLCDDREDESAALRQQLATAWLPMDSAPKNGEEILVLFDAATVNVVRLCWYNDGSDLMNCMEACSSAVGWWFYQHSVTQEQVDLDLMKPLGWMPMPRRPQA